MDEKKIKILVVDDEEDFRNLMIFWLESRGYQVLSASEGTTAVKLAQEQSPDIVFLDLRMPVLNGVEVLKRIRSFNVDLPVIIISAYVSDPCLKEAFQYGISGIFNKGKDFQDCLSLLETALRTHSKLKKLE
jgi:CheY-like chemotaxis protein